MAIVAYGGAFFAYFMSLLSYPLAVAYVSIVGLTSVGVAVAGWIGWSEKPSILQFVALAAIMFGVSVLHHSK